MSGRQPVGQAGDAATTKDDLAQTSAGLRCSYRTGNEGRTVKVLQRLQDFRADQNLENSGWVRVMETGSGVGGTEEERS